MTEPIRLAFPHGLGDCVNFAHTLPLWRSRGYPIDIECTPDKAPIFRAAGAVTYDLGTKGFPAHPWNEPTGWDMTPGRPWFNNKTGVNLSNGTMPDIGPAEALWDEVCQTALPIEGAGFDVGAYADAIERADEVLTAIGAGFNGRPAVLLHANANTSPHAKDLHPLWLWQFYSKIIDETNAVILVLDWDDRTACPYHARIRHLWREFAWKPDLAGLHALMCESSVFVGVDSGPLHFLRLTRTNGVGLWRGHRPYHYALPRPRTVHVAPAGMEGENVAKRWPFRIVTDQGSAGPAELCPGNAAAVVRDLLKYKSLGRFPGEVDEVYFQHFLKRTRGTEGNGSLVDRQRSFAKAFAYLPPDATIVETGSVRHPEDWPGAGYFGVLAGMFLSLRGSGKLHTVELDPARADFARKVTREFGDRVEVHTADSRDFLEKWRQDGQRKIDLLYSDSADLGTPGYEECCLAEVTTATAGADIEPRRYGAQMILIDDTFWRSGRWHGKGSLAVPHLLARGWVLEYSGDQALLRRP